MQMSQAEGFLKLTASVVSTVDSTGSDVTHPEAWPTTSANGRSSVERQEFPPEQHLSELQATGTRRHRTLWTRTNRWRNIGPEQHEHFMQHIQCSPGGGAIGGMFCVTDSYLPFLTFYKDGFAPIMLQMRVVDVQRQ